VAKVSAKPNATPKAETLLAWYDRHRRTLPWRALPGESVDPYRVWLSEIMLQQTTVAAVKPYFDSFLARWPRIEDLAAAELDEVLHAWAGLGYYARARNLHKCAKVVAADYGGRFPDTEDGLAELPGIGPYTAAAIAAIAFDRVASPVDGNIERVVARLFAVEESMPAAKPKLCALAATLTPPGRAGDYAQAAMDLGATICTPRKPACSLCPWLDVCRARALGRQEDFPVRVAKTEKPTRRGVVYWAIDAKGQVLLRRREEKGLLGGMIEFPSTAWTEAGARVADAIVAAPVTADWVDLPGLVRHTFTHFHLELIVLAGHKAKGAGLWSPLDKLSDHALPNLMKKVARHALKHVS
jgi:A/G-specific adenine glycosylase